MRNPEEKPDNYQERRPRGGGRGDNRRGPRDNRRGGRDNRRAGDRDRRGSGNYNRRNDRDNKSERFEKKSFDLPDDHNVHEF